MRVLLTGATGFIGLRVAALLAEAMPRPRVLVRRPSRGALLSALDVEPVYGSLESPDSLRRALDGVDAVIHLAGRATFERLDRLRPTLVEGTRRLAEMAAAGGAGRFVFASSVFVHGDEPEPITASTPVSPVIGYGRAKAEAERAVESIGSASGMAVGSIRLPHVYGARSLLFSYAQRGVVPFFGRGDNTFSHLHVDDAARVMVAAAQQGWQGRAPVGDDRPATWNELFEVLTAFEPRVRVVRVPSIVGVAGAGAAAQLRRVLPDRPSMAAPDTVVGWNLHQAIRPRSLWEDLDIEPLYPTIESGIPAALDACIPFRWRHPVKDHSRW